MLRSWLLVLVVALAAVAAGQNPPTTPPVPAAPAAAAPPPRDPHAKLMLEDNYHLFKNLGRLGWGSPTSLPLGFLLQSI